MDTINRIWPTGTSEMAERIRSFDWAATPLGPIQSWPPGLRAVVDLMLSSDVPMSMLWGAEAIQVYNDAYAAAIAARHPGALGVSAFDTFDNIHPIVDQAMGGGTVSLRELPYRYPPGYRDQPLAWFDVTCTPVRSDSGAVAGVLIFLFESTTRVLAEQELARAATDREEARAALANELAGMALLHEVSSIALGATGLQELLDAILDATIGLHKADFGNVQMYDPVTRILRIVAQRGFQPPFLDRFAEVDAQEDSACGLALARMERVVIEDVETDPVYAPSVPAAREAGYRAVQSTPLLNAAGEPIGMLSTHFRGPRHFSEHELRQTDLFAHHAAAAIERTRAETALRESDERQKRMINIQGVGVLQIDKNGTLIGANDWFLAMAGYTREQFAGKQFTWQDMTLSGSAADHASQLRHMVDSGRIGPYETEYRRADGSRSWMLIAGADLGDGSIVEYCIDVNDRKRAEAALRDSEASLQRRVDEATAELRTLSRRLLAMQEDERRRLSRELYEEIGQMLTGLQLQLASARRANVADRSTILDQALDIVQDLTARISELSMDLRPAALDTLGLLPSLLWHIERFQTSTGISVDFRHQGLDRRFPPGVEITAYRIVQEALSNVARHAQAGSTAIQVLADDGNMTIMIRDTGHGFDPIRVAAQGGLTGMRERVEFLGGTLSLESAPEAGTVVTVEIPSAEPAQPGVMP